MEQEKFSSLNKSSSNSSMPRETVESLKQFKKQGLSVSLVTTASTTTTDTRSKSNALIEKSIKITPSRPQSTTENKAQIIPTRLTSIADTRVISSSCVTNQSKPNQTTVSESKGFSQVWSNPNSSVDKSQSTTSRPMTVSPKIQPNQVRIFMADNKIPISRSSQSMHNENKTPVRVSTNQRIIQNPQLVEGKIQNSQGRVNAMSSDVKTFSNQGRTGQRIFLQDKSVPVQKSVVQKVVDPKTPSQLNTNKSDIKTPQVNRIASNMKAMSEVNQSKTRSNYVVKSDGKTNVTGTSPMVVENKMVNSVRLVTNVVDGNSTQTTQCKSTQMRIHPNASGGETQTAVQTKIIRTAVRTEMICFQSVENKIQAENKVVLQGAKTTSDMFQKTSTVFDMSTEAAHGGGMSRISTAKRSATVVTTPVKKKCNKRTSPGSTEMINKNVEGSNVSSPEDGSENKAHFFNSIKTNRTGLTITPVHSSVGATPSTSSGTAGKVRLSKEMLLDKAVYQHFGRAAALIKSPRGKSRCRGRRRVTEPVCLTLSSDEEEEHMQASFSNFEEALSHQMFPHESEGSKSGQSSPVYQDEDNQESDDPQFPGVTDINTKALEEELYDDEEEEDEEKELDEMEMDEEDSIGEEEEEEEEIEGSELDEEEVPPEDEEEEPCLRPLDTSVNVPLLCRSVRIGSFKIHPPNNNKTLNVFLTPDGISFKSPLSPPAYSNRPVNITVKPSDVTHMLVHFGKCLPILFIFTTVSYAEGVRRSLQMVDPEHGFFDPSSDDDRVQKLTFLIDSVTEEQRRFLRNNFLNESKVREIDQKTANEILVKSTPNKNNTQIIRCEAAQPQPQRPQPPPPPPPPPQVPPENVLTVTAIQPAIQIKLVNPQPVTRLFTYPAPPVTGGIPITNEDLACLNEGEFLNDAIIDFYLKYVFHEKLSDYHREKTHIFSSYFYHRLTHKPERPRPGDEVLKNIQMRRHSQVKTWTRHVDIFSKDFIIIPVNQNVHWLLAIICYPWLVPEAPELPVKSESKTNKSTDNVTSTDDQEESKTSKEPNSTEDGNNQISDENSTASSSSFFENEEPDSEEPAPEAPDSSTHPDKNCRRREVPCICIFDSLNGPNRSRIATMLREYLEVEWRLKKGTRKVFDKNTMHGYIMQCPQQTNYSDCGIYVLQYVESFFESPLPYFDMPIPNLSNWFPKEKVAKKRQELKDLIISLQKKYASNPNNRNSTLETVPSSQAQMVQTDNR